MPDALARFAEVAVPLAVQGTFTYSIPDDLRDQVRTGCRVEVPWGPKVTTAFVVGLSDDAAIAPARIRPLRAVLDDDEPALLPEIVELCRWAASYYLTSLGEMLRVALPANMASAARRLVYLTGSDEAVRTALTSAAIADADLPLLHSLGESAPREVAQLSKQFDGARRALRRLAQAGLVSIREELRDAEGVRYDRFALLLEGCEGLPPKQQEVVDFLRANGGSASIAALRDAGRSSSALETLARKSIVRIERRPRRHTLDAFLSALGPVHVGELRHTEEQRAAIDAILPAFGTFAPFLLQGVTGSGKTEVYIELMREAVRRGEQALLLVPEISLTPVFAARLKERFGDRIAILHSGLSPSERYDQWWRTRRGEVDVAIGPRSALFSPFPRLGLVIVDEEGDAAYKQDESPRYNARDLAVVRARLQQIPVVLGSATPSLETRENAERGKYAFIRMEKRVEERQLPSVELIDIRREKGEKEDRGMIIFAGETRRQMEEVFGAGEQVMILINRRGYAPFLLCRECENDFNCRDCSVSMTVHRRAGLLICHYCGFRRPIPAVCPKCEGEVLQPIGYGTEKVEERFRLTFPEVTVDVLDRDSTRRKGELVRILDRFRRGATQALIGTQMISKGHDFPNVTLTAVLNADSILGFPDFRSAEKTFYLLTQVSGRSGRGERPGRVVIQTAFPEHYAIRHAIRHDYEGFYRDEIDFRRRFHYPPATGMIAILFRGEDAREVEEAAGRAERLLRQHTDGIADLRVQGPAPAPLSRIKGVWRYQILLRSGNRAALRSAVERAFAGKEIGSANVMAVIDVDPLTIL